MTKPLLKLKSVEKNEKSVTLWEVSDYQEAYYLIKTDKYLSAKIEDLGVANNVFELKLKELFDETRN